MLMGSCTTLYNIHRADTCTCPQKKKTLFKVSKIMVPPTLHMRGCAVHARQHVRLRTLGSRLGVAAPRAQAAENGPSRLSTNVGNVDSVRGRTQQPQVPSKPPAGVQVHDSPTACHTRFSGRCLRCFGFDERTGRAHGLLMRLARLAGDRARRRCAH